jgi:predicted ArsR family transcriptional regulator
VDAIEGPGLGSSQRTLLERLKRLGTASLGELEGDFGLARETVRDHLKALGAEGLVERAGVRREGPGRPQVLYRLSAEGERLFPRREGELLRELATFLIDDGREDLLAAFFERRAAGKRERLAARVAGLDPEPRLREVAAILTEEGFLAEAAGTAGTPGVAGPPRLRLCHCPLREVVAVSHLPCRAELALIEELLGRRLERQTFIPDGASACTYAVLERAGDASDATTTGTAAAAAVR